MKKFSISILILLVLSAGLFAEGGEEHHFDWSGFLGKVLNSTILFGGLALLFRKPLIESLTKQSLDTKVLLKETETNLDEKSKELDKLKTRIAGLEKEIESMKKEAKENGEEEKRKIEALAKKESERIIRNSEDEIDSRVESAVRELKARIADLTIDKFKKDFGSKLNDKRHNSIIGMNIDKIGELSERD